ncbi:hypothetical protein LSTR_LSTR006236 [Laodelphax striatellus]|uniref:Uncharacterized protein n=1 Tax=Laodelphax striatellus TaxID=195883 RepID=A0A482XS39_LAOST|nr:hypothetical protein LSTR_LSTR006236 [Laodelphax striatellus]
MGFRYNPRQLNVHNVEHTNNTGSSTVWGGVGERTSSQLVVSRRSPVGLWTPTELHRIVPDRNSVPRAFEKCHPGEGEVQLELIPPVRRLCSTFHFHPELPAEKKPSQTARRSSTLLTWQAITSQHSTR